MARFCSGSLDISKKIAFIGNYCKNIASTAAVFAAAFQRTNTILLIKFTLSGAPSNLHHSFGSKLYLIHPFSLEHSCIGSYCAEATLRIDTQSVRGDNAETMLYGYVESNEMRTYTALSILGIPHINIQIQEGFSDMLVYPIQILK